MSGNPRKFSEKIAIQQRKLNEEQAAFASVIAEVATITRGDSSAQTENLGPPLSWQRTGGSLPNVYRVTQQPQNIQDPMVVYGGQWPGTSSMVAQGNDGFNARMSSQTRGRSPGSGGGHAHAAHYHPYRSVSPQVSPGGASPVRHHSPERVQMMYPNSHMYLVPPQDTWRRTHSDPGIHASVTHPTFSGGQQTQAMSQNHASPIGSPAVDNAQGAGGFYLEPKGNMNPVQLRPHSCENVPNLPPNINIHQSEAVAGPQIPISNNTGSLPDLPSSLLPGQSQLQHMEGVHNEHPPSYSHAVNATGGGMGGPQPGSCQGASHQQRHSIQLPVQYPQGSIVSGSGQKYIAYGNPAAMPAVSQSYGSSAYPPESPRSAPTSPNGGGCGSTDSPASPQAQNQSPGSAFYNLQTQMQNINIDAHDSTMVNQYYGSHSYSNHPAQYSALASSSQMPVHPTLIFQQQPVHVRQQPVLQQRSSHPMVQMQQSLNSPNSNQIPDIIFTGADGSISAGMGGIPGFNSAGGYIDPAVELLSSDLRTSLDPIDLQSLQGLGNEQGLNIDAASEDELRRDRI